MDRHQNPTKCAEKSSGAVEDRYVREWRAFRRWANSANANDITRRLRGLLETNPIASALWEEHCDSRTRGIYRRSKFWDGNHRVCVDSVGGAMTQDYFGLYVDKHNTATVNHVNRESIQWSFGGCAV